MGNDAIWDDNNVDDPIRTGRIETDYHVSYHKGSREERGGYQRSGWKCGLDGSNGGAGGEERSGR